MSTKQEKQCDFMHELCLQRSKTFWSVGSEGLFLHSLLKTGVRRKRIDLVAQLVEHNTFNVGALGSSPSGITRL